MEQQQELKRLFHMLEETAKIAVDAALTETFSGGETQCISQFNNSLKRLSEIGGIPDGLFEALPEDASFSQIGIACHQLTAYLNADLEETTDFKGWFSTFWEKSFMENLTEAATDKPFSDLIRKAVPDFLTETNLEDILDTFPVEPGGKLTVDADIGAIEVKSIEGNNVSIRVRRTAELKADRRAGEILKDLDIQITHETADVKIEAKFRGATQRWKKVKERLDVQFDLLVPQHYTLDLKTQGAGISVTDIVGDVKTETGGASLRLEKIIGHIEGTTSGGNVGIKAFEGDTTLQTSGGNITLEAGTGDVKAKTSGGHIQITYVTGAVNAHTSGGNVMLRGCKGGADLKTAGGSIEVDNDGPVLAKTSGGSIRCQLQETLPSQNLLLDLEAISGSINVSLAPDIAATLESRVLGGSVTTEFPVAVETTGIAKIDQLHGTINGGGPRLRLFAVGGNIILRKTDTATSTEA